MLKKITSCILIFSLVTSSLLSTTSFAWASYDSKVGSYVSATPLHEDMTQFAYGLLIQKHYLPQENAPNEVSMDTKRMASGNPSGATSETSSSTAQSTSSEASSSSSSIQSASSDISSSSAQSASVDANASSAPSASMEPGLPSNESRAGDAAAAATPDALLQADTLVQASETGATTSLPAPAASSVPAASSTSAASSTPAASSVPAASSTSAASSTPTASSVPTASSTSAAPVAENANDGTLALPQTAPMSLVEQTNTPSQTELLKATDDQSYQNNLYFLRMGSYWNDVSANNFIDFGKAFLSANSIAQYTHKYNGLPIYGKAANVGLHLKDSADQKYSRSMVRFSFNERANFLHSMLGTEADGSYLTPAKALEFQMQWMRVAYEFASKGKAGLIDADDKALFQFIDPYSQLDGTGRPAEVGSSTPADDKMTETQMRLRALGSLCHTIEDSFNPAHTIRSYNDDPAQFGTILALGNYKTQGKDNHMPWDMPAKADATLRTDLFLATQTWATLEAKVDVEAKMETARTLGLYLAWNAAHTLMEKFNSGATWAEVEQWLKDDIFKTNFVNDASIIWDAGRRAGNITDLSSETFIMEKALKEQLPKGTVNFVAFSKAGFNLKIYHSRLRHFFQGKLGESITKPIYHASDEEEKNGQDAVKAALQSLQEGLNQSTKEELDAAFKTFTPVMLTRLMTVVKNLNGMAQEFALDLQGQLDPVSQANADAILNIITRAEVTEYTGVLAANDSTGKAYYLRMADPDGADALVRIGYGVTEPAASRYAVGQRVTIQFFYATPDYAGQPLQYTANAITGVPNDTKNTYMAKGILKSRTDSSITLTPDSTQIDFALKLENKDIVADNLVGTRVCVVYQAIPNEPMTALSVDAANEPEITSLSTATVEMVYGEQMHVRVGDIPDLSSVDELPAPPRYYNVYYSDADLVGTPSVGAKVDIFYPNWAKEAFAGMSDEDAIIGLPDASFQDSLDAPILASRIVCDNHTHDYRYLSNGNNTHQKYCVTLDKAFPAEPCVPNPDGKCTLCQAASHIQLIQNGKTTEYAWNAADLQKAFDAAQNGAVIQLVPLNGVNTLNLGSTMVSANSTAQRGSVTLRLGGATLEYSGAQAALFSSLAPLTLENGVVSSRNNALEHADGSAATVLSGVTLHAQNGYTVTGGILTLNSAGAGEAQSYLTGGGVDKIDKPVEIRLNGHLQSNQIVLALPESPAFPLTAFSFLENNLATEDLSKICLGTKNQYTGNAVFAIAGNEIKLLEILLPPAPKKTTINGVSAENSTFSIGTTLTLKAYAYDGDTPAFWSINPNGTFTQIGTSDAYTSGPIHTENFAPGEHVLTIVHRKGINLTAEVYKVNFQKGGDVPVNEPAHPAQAAGVIAKTGDNTPIALLIALIAICAAVLAFVWLRKKRASL